MAVDGSLGTVGMSDNAMSSFQKPVSTRVSLERHLSQRLIALDYIGLRDHPAVVKMLSLMQSSDGEEHVLFSDYIVKINQRNRPQERIIMVTNVAIYNLLPVKYRRARRRIRLRSLESITTSMASDEFVLHIPSEYDYRMISLRKMELLKIVSQAFKDLTGEKLVFNQSPLLSLKSFCITRSNARKKKSQPNDSESKSYLNVRDCSGFSSQTTDTTQDIGSNHGPPKSKKVVKGWHNSVSEVGPDDFEPLRVLGRGSFGKVIMVKKKIGEDFDQIYAMKVLRIDMIIRRNQVEHTKAEREILANINHPFLINLYYAFQVAGKLYFVMEFLSGGELFYHLKTERRFSEPRARFYAAEIALGIGHLHSCNVIYRDLKLENVLLDSSGHVKLTDFGLSKRYDEGTVATTFCGSPEYLAPEVISHAGHNKDVDWWSFGILIHEFIIGLPPFYSRNVRTMYKLIGSAKLRRSSFVSNPAWALITGLLERDPKKRLGHGVRDVEDIKQAAFFSSIDWEKLLRREIKPEFVPKVKSACDTKYFDPEFTQQTLRNSIVSDSNAIETAAFHGFAYESSEKRIHWTS